MIWKEAFSSRVCFLYFTYDNLKMGRHSDTAFGKGSQGMCWMWKKSGVKRGGRGPELMFVHCELIREGKEFTVYSYITICEQLRIFFFQVVICGGTD